MAKYLVFTKPGCGTCKNVVSILKARKVEFEEINVSTEAGLNLAAKYKVTHSGAILDKETETIIPLEKVGIVEDSGCESCKM